jgi:hypothetical protein
MLAMIICLCSTTVAGRETREIGAFDFVDEESFKSKVNGKLDLITAEPK